MTEEQLYDEAFQQMVAAPLEQDEPGGPGRRPGSPGGNRNRWANHTKRAHVSIRVDAAVYEWLEIEADNRDVSVRNYINSLLRTAYEAAGH